MIRNHDWPSVSSVVGAEFSVRELSHTHPSNARPNRARLDEDGVGEGLPGASPSLCTEVALCHRFGLKIFFNRPKLELRLVSPSAQL